MSFQLSAFQRNAFQIGDTGQRQGTGWGEPEKLWHWPQQKKRLEERIEALPDEVVDAVIEAVELESPAERERRLTRELEGVELKFQRVYLLLLEQYYSVLMDEQLALMLEAEKRRKEDELLILLLS